MLCDNCKKRQATIRYEENINGEKKKVNLCAICSNELGILSHNLMDNMLFSFFDDPLSIGYEKAKTEKCSKCGYTYYNYAKTGLLGCDECYRTFENKLTPILKKLHGKSQHINVQGNRKINTKKSIEKDNDINLNKIDVLKKELNKAIEKEEYEKAAEIRDKIKALKERGEK